MTPVFQTIYGPNGNCYRACLATMLDKSINEIPDFRCYNKQWAIKLSTYLREHYDIKFICGKYKLLNEFKFKNYYIASALTPCFDIHAVLCKNGKIVHDPSPRPLVADKSPVTLLTLFKSHDTRISKTSTRSCTTIR